MALPITTLFRNASTKSMVARLKARVAQGRLSDQYAGDSWTLGEDILSIGAPMGAMGFLLEKYEKAEDGSVTPKLIRSEGIGAYEEFLASDSYEDLCRVFGKPIGVRFADGPAVLKKGGRLLGLYKSGEDVIELNPASLSYVDARIAITHEMVHVWQARQGDFIESIWSEYEIKPPKSNTYASSSKIEHQAEAITSAIICLDVLARPDLEAAHKRKVLRDMEKYVPGVRVFTRIFLSHPVFKYRLANAAKQANIVPLEPPEPWTEPVCVDAHVRSTLLDACEKSGVASMLLTAWGKIMREGNIENRARREAKLERARL